MHWFANRHAILNTVPSVVTVYDLQPFLNFASYSPFKRSYLRWMMLRTLSRAAMLLPISQTTTYDLQHLLGAEPARMTVIPVIIGQEFRRAPAEAVITFQARYHLPNRFMLYVANMDLHKNHV